MTQKNHHRRREIRRLLSNGFSQSDIAAELELSRARVQQLCAEIGKAGLTPAGRAALSAAGRRRWRHVERDSRIRSLVEYGCSFRATAKRLGLTLGVVAGAMRRGAQRIAPH